MLHACVQEMDRAFGGDGSSVPSADTMQEAATCLYFPADLRESSDEYKFIIDLPGVPKSDIKVSLTIDCLLYSVIPVHLLYVACIVCCLGLCIAERCHICAAISHLALHVQDSQVHCIAAQ